MTDTNKDEGRFYGITVYYPDLKTYYVGNKMLHQDEAFSLVSRSYEYMEKIRTTILKDEHAIVHYIQYRHREDSLRQRCEEMNDPALREAALKGGRRVWYPELDMGKEANSEGIADVATLYKLSNFNRNGTITLTDEEECIRNMGGPYAEASIYTP